MSKSESLSISQIYVPVKRRGAVDPKIVHELAESILQIGQQTPIVVRRDGDRFVLIEGLQRLEACKALGEETIIGRIADDGEIERPRAASAYEAQAEAERHKMERLKALRLEKQAAEQSSTPTAAGHDAVKTKLRDRSSRSDESTRSKPVNLSEWLAEREHDGFRR